MTERKFPTLPKNFGFNDGREKEFRDLILSKEELRNRPIAIIDFIDDHVRNYKGMMVYEKPKVDLSRSLLAGLDPYPKVLVELGTYVGSSAVAWGEILRSLNKGPQGIKVFAVELNEEFAQIAKDLVEFAGLSDIVTILQGESTQIISSLQSAHGVDKIDVLFIDHWERFYLPDLQKCEELGLFHKGSLVLADNTDIPGAPAYLEYVRAGGKEGGVKYSTKNYKTDAKAFGPNTVEVTEVVEIP